MGGLCDAMELGPCVGSGLCVGGRVDYGEGFIHRSGSSNGEGRGVVRGMRVGSNAKRRDPEWKPSVGEGQTTHPPTMVEEVRVQETLLSLSLTVVLVTMESKGATVAADTA